MLNSICLTLLNVLCYYIFVYPATLCLVWITAGIYYVWRNERKSKYEKKPPRFLPAVTILVPCYNEEKVIHLTCKNLRSLDYPNYRVLFIDDASTDNTTNVIKQYVNDVPFFHLLKLEENHGKANALNNALPLVITPLVLILDADTILEKKALNWLAAPFVYKPNIGAITANVFPKDCSGFWGKFQASEFASIIGLIKRAQSVWGSIFTVSGCSTMYKTEILRQVGGFSSFTATEDIDVSWRIQRTFSRVLFEPKAIAYISVPQKLSQYIKQRKRWVLGGWHLLKQHKNVFSDVHMYRLWVVYIELVLSCFWAFCFTGTILLWIISFFFEQLSVFTLIPGWYGALASFLYLIQTLIGIIIGCRYNKSIIKCFSAACWYPLVFFTINPVLVVITSIKGIFGNPEKSSRWSSPTRVENQE